MSYFARSQQAASTPNISPHNPKNYKQFVYTFKLRVKATFKRFDAFYCLYGANIPFKRYEAPKARKRAFLRAFNTVGLYADRINQSEDAKKGAEAPQIAGVN